MRYTRFEMEIRHKVYVGGYETIEPCVRLVADIDEKEDLEDVRKIVAKKLQLMITKEMIEELRLVHRRRGDNPPPSNDTVPALMGTLKPLAQELDTP